jgi:hypothetical protein
MTKEKYLEDLGEIRSMMEQSSRFLSLSGLSGVTAGLVALTGALVVFWKLNFKLYPYYEEVYDANGMVRTDFAAFVGIVAVLVLCVALGAGLLLTIKKTKKEKQHFWTPAARRMLINLAIPLAGGGVFCCALLWHQQAYLIACTMLIFYGLALLNASKYTLNDIRYLGIAELLLGLLALFITGYALLFWAIGFGVLHIIYGYVMYVKYDK